MIKNINNLIIIYFSKIQFSLHIDQNGNIHNFNLNLLQFQGIERINDLNKAI